MGDEMGCELLSPDPRVLPDRISVYGPSLCRGPGVDEAVSISAELKAFAYVNTRGPLSCDKGNTPKYLGTHASRLTRYC
ncbi:hypothetical protein BSLG_007237 [Batrachochytrium salamandrivorans]|nr:hypothetical protein BSLG_007237 [Batrachochytrium salamandrivorans]